MFNKVVLVGNLTRDIELRYLPNGSALGKTGIAVTRRYNANGEKKEETCFIDLDFWGKTAEIANQYLRKGSKILIEGRLRFDQWQDQNGQSRSKHSIYVETMEMLTPQNSGNSGNFGAQNSNYGNFNQNNAYQNSNQNSGYANYKNSGNFANSQPKQNFQNAPKQEAPEHIPDIDVDADMDENLPF